MSWTKIKAIEQTEDIEVFDTILRYNHAGIIPDELTGASYAENYQVQSIEGDRFTIQRQSGTNIQRMLDAVFPTGVTRDNLVAEGKWFINTEKSSGHFIP